MAAAGHKMCRAALVTTHSNTCDCWRVNSIAYDVELEEAWKLLVLNRWRKLYPSASISSPSRRVGAASGTLRACRGRTWRAAELVKLEAMMSHGWDDQPDYGGPKPTWWNTILIVLAIVVIAVLFILARDWHHPLRLG
jgi:hypothetical protein